MALGAFCNGKGLCTVVAGSAELPGLHIIHRNLVAVFLHFEERGMAGIALETGIGMGFTVEDDLTLFYVEFNFLTRWNSHSAARKT